MTRMSLRARICSIPRCERWKMPSIIPAYANRQNTRPALITSSSPLLGQTILVEATARSRSKVQSNLKWLQRAMLRSKRLIALDSLTYCFNIRWLTTMIITSMIRSSRQARGSKFRTLLISTSCSVKFAPVKCKRRMTWRSEWIVTRPWNLRRSTARSPSLQTSSESMNKSPRKTSSSCRIRPRISSSCRRMSMRRSQVSSRKMTRLMRKRKVRTA